MFSKNIWKFAIIGIVLLTITGIICLSSLKGLANEITYDGNSNMAGELDAIKKNNGASDASIDSDIIIKPQVDVPVDLEAEKFSQQQVDEGHSPWRLDPIQTTITFVSLKIYPEGVTGKFPISEKDINIVEQTSKAAIVDVSGEKTPIKRVYLQRLVRQDDTGIWSVVGYDPVEK